MTLHTSIVAIAILFRRIENVSEKGNIYWPEPTIKSLICRNGYKI
ncbi:hypothetical protein [Rufibacter immobilis]|nr:hypothetical protein [Rufibacter immobilis]